MIQKRNIVSHFMLILYHISSFRSQYSQLWLQCQDLNRIKKIIGLKLDSKRFANLPFWLLIFWPFLLLLDLTENKVQCYSLWVEILTFPSIWRTECHYLATSLTLGVLVNCTNSVSLAICLIRFFLSLFLACFIHDYDDRKRTLSFYVTTILYFLAILSLRIDYYTIDEELATASWILISLNMSFELKLSTCLMDKVCFKVLGNVVLISS
jgi:hypothetical protein